MFGTARTRIVLKNDQGQVLLQQTWLSGNKWGLPGGGVERGESPAAAASRELREETGIVILEEAMQQTATLKAAGHDEVVFLAFAPSSALGQPPNRFEVKAAGWFSLDELPSLESLAAKVLDKVAKKD